MPKKNLTYNIQRTLPDAQIVETPLPLCPEMSLYLISADNMQRRFSVDETHRIIGTAPYWSFCWASGQAMASYIFAHRDLIEEKSILDFGSGSGVVAVAAAMAGAGEVIACDNDQAAIDAIKANAELNRVQVNTCESLVGISDSIDLIITADVLYDRENHHFLIEFLSMASLIFIADSRLKTLDVRPYKKIAEIETTILPDLSEGDEFKHVNIYRKYFTDSLEIHFL